ncbi:cupin domain-containing protein [Sphingomonas sp. BIUV-7]|uniref:Cupin domain-containing protein n=1 Tax=Sphingomonas natans TaxID=3063330 RepID=A0ABT8YEC0_9SPHN|nr:cupin domain-containing protein [Sphingomonas sp. BIUV-7]MDO6416292.1 cupin domain-containing protein [Sphingomonas sp. BIUV-7]
MIIRRIALGLALTFLDAASSAAQTPHQTGHVAMDIIRKADLKTTEGPGEYFTGKVTVTGQFQREAPSRVGAAIVHFEAGARSAWHTHPLGQTLIVTEGIGLTQVEDGPTLLFHAGDQLWCPADRKHWHGATPDSAMTHIAIQEAKDGSPVTWLEHVSEEDYLAASRLANAD